MSTVLGQVTIILTFSNGSTLSLGVSSDTGESRVRTKPLDFIGSDQSGGFSRDSTRRKMVTGIRFEFDPMSTGVTECEIFTRDKLEDAPTSHGVFIVDNDGFVRCRLPARRYYEFELKDNGSVTRWGITGIEIFGAPAGDRKL